MRNVLEWSGCGITEMLSQDLYGGTEENLENVRVAGQDSILVPPKEKVIVLRLHQWLGELVEMTLFCMCMFVLGSWEGTDKWLHFSTHCRTGSGFQGSLNRLSYLCSSYKRYHIWTFCACVLMTDCSVARSRDSLLIITYARRIMIQETFLAY
jgi:hypothetical protein